MIESVNNDKVKFYTKLTTRKYQDKLGLFLVEGEHLVKEAESSGLLQEVITIEENDYNFSKVTYVSENVMKKISSLNTPPKIMGVVKKILPREIRGRVLILDGIQNPGNLGTIIRSAVAFNIDTIILGNNTVSIYNPKVIRASEGMIFHINIIFEDVKTCINKLKEKGYSIYVTDVLGGTPISKVPFEEKMALVIGNEGSGVSKDILELGTHIYIEMNESCESLNVGVATSIILYELSKR